MYTDASCSKPVRISSTSQSASKDCTNLSSCVQKQNGFYYKEFCSASFFGTIFNSTFGATPFIDQLSFADNNCASFNDIQVVDAVAVGVCVPEWDFSNFYNYTIESLNVYNDGSCSGPVVSTFSRPLDLCLKTTETSSIGFYRPRQPSDLSSSGGTGTSSQSSASNTPAANTVFFGNLYSDSACTRLVLSEAVNLSATTQTCALAVSCQKDGDYYYKETCGTDYPITTKAAFGGNAYLQQSIYNDGVCTTSNVNRIESYAYNVCVPSWDKSKSFIYTSAMAKTAYVGPLCQGTGTSSTLTPDSCFYFTLPSGIRNSYQYHKA
jgi:hypothetical protein